MRLTHQHGHGLFVLSLSLPGLTIAASCWTANLARPMAWCFGLTRGRGVVALSIGPVQLSWRRHG